MYSARTRLGHYLQAYGRYVRNDQLRLKTLADLDRDFKHLHQRFPENKAIGLWAGQLTIPWPTHYSDAPQAPQWANLQRRCLEGMTDEIHWWIDNRQMTGGFFGTGWGDDVEMWRVWLPILAGFDDPKVNHSQEKLASALLSQKHLAKGYSSKMNDVEHTAEDTSDVITPMMLINRDDQQWRQRAMKITEIAKAKWMGKNQRGQWQHMSSFLNVDGIDSDPVHAVDTTYHCRIYQPAMLAWQRGQAPDFGPYFTRWIETWVDASMREERGKPAGVLPTAIRWPDGTVGGLKDPWWNPNILNGSLYRWPSFVANQMMCNAMLLCWHQTDDDKYLKPILAMGQMRLDDAQGKIAKSNQPGELGWLVSNFEKFLLPVLAKYRLLSGDRRFDEILQSDDKTGYLRYRLTGHPNGFIGRLEMTALALSQNMELYTSQCRAGDRLFVAPSRYFNQSQHVDDLPSLDIGAVYATVTGDPDMSMYGSVAAVRWMTVPREIAALVTDATSKQFAADLFHFGDQPRPMSAQLYMLAYGTYQWQLLDQGKVLSEGTLNRQQSVTELSFELPSHTLCQLRVAPKP